MKRKMPRAATAVLVSGGLGLAGLGLAAGTAHAEPIPAPMYHWCPGEFWDWTWGFNWDWDDCHDDFHRDIDGDWHGRDWHPDWDRSHDQNNDRGPWLPWWPH
jgi:hypothetical protein